ncbi:MAG: hypothetical protein ACPGLV_10840 [Bacteroidia bacterium]
MQKFLFLLLLICVFNGLKAQSKANLVLKKVDQSQTIEIENGDMLKVKTTDGEQHKGKFVKVDGEQLITSYDTLNLADIELIKANTKMNRQQNSLLLTSSLVALGVGAGLGLVISNSTNEIEGGARSGMLVLMAASYIYAGGTLLYQILKVNTYKSYQIQGNRAKWLIQTK